MAGSQARRVDQTALKSNQAFIMALLLTGFVLDSLLPVAFVAIVMLAGTWQPQLALFKQIYRKLLRPAGLLKPNIIEDNPEPHRFAQGFGGIVVTFSLLLLLLNLSAAGWILSWVVIMLAALNFFLGFCAGCTIYYQLNRLGISGFDHAPLGRG